MRIIAIRIPSIIFGGRILSFNHKSFGLTSSIITMVIVTAKNEIRARTTIFVHSKYKKYNAAATIAIHLIS